MRELDEKIWAAYDKLQEIGIPSDPLARRVVRDLVDALAALSDAYTQLADELAVARGSYR